MKTPTPRRRRGRQQRYPLETIMAAVDRHGGPETFGAQKKAAEALEMSTSGVNDAVKRWRERQASEEAERSVWPWPLPRGYATQANPEYVRFLACKDVLDGLEVSEGTLDLAMETFKATLALLPADDQEERKRVVTKRCGPYLVTFYIRACLWEGKCIALTNPRDGDGDEFFVTR